MAHIKVVRRSMRPEEWINLRFGWLKRYIYSEKHEITTFRIKDARQVSEMNFDFYDGGDTLKGEQISFLHTRWE